MNSKMVYFASLTQYNINGTTMSCDMQISWSIFTQIVYGQMWWRHPWKCTIHRNFNGRTYQKVKVMWLIILTEMSTRSRWRLLDLPSTFRLSQTAWIRFLIRSYSATAACSVGSFASTDNKWSISSSEDFSKSMLRRSRLSIYITPAVHSANVWKVEQMEHGRIM